MAVMNTSNNQFWSFSPAHEKVRQSNLQHRAFLLFPAPVSLRAFSLVLVVFSMAAILVLQYARLVEEGDKMLSNYGASATLSSKKVFRGVFRQGLKEFEKRSMRRLGE